MILARRAQLASGLRRPLSATWPAPVPHEHEGRLELWVGFHDISKAKPPAWPLLRAGQTDVFASFPFGTDPRGRPVAAQLFEHNWLIGAAPGQGKTAAVRVVACAAALDPLAELWTHELAGKGDLEPLARVSHRYCSGLDDEAIAYAAESMRMLRAELESRSRKLKAIPKESAPGRQDHPGHGRPRWRGCPRWSASSTRSRTCSCTRSTAPGRRRRGVRDPARPRLRRDPGAGHPAPDTDSLPTTVAGTCPSGSASRSPARSRTT